MSMIDQLIDEIEEQWDFEGPPAPGEIAAAEAVLGGPLPQPLADFYHRADGASIGHVDVFMLDEFRDVNKRRSGKDRDAVFFASDGADGFFLLDRDNRMKKGSGAVFWVDRGSRGTRGRVFAAPDLVAFLRLAAAGQTPWIAPSLADVDLDGMRAALETHHERWSGNPPAEGRTTFDAGFRLGVRMPDELEALLEISNGFRIPGAGLTVLGADELEPVAGTAVAGGRPGAIWFAQDDRGNRYAATVIGWRGSEGGDVVRVGAGESPGEAPIIGSLPAVVASWLEGEKRR
jgi:hypothetical protein